MMTSYKQVNCRSSSKCVYRIGNESGFFSEINNMIMAMVFCLENNLNFQICSANSIYGDDIWKDYFSPFTAHKTSFEHLLFNERPYIQKIPHKLTVEELFVIKKAMAKQFLTSDIWPYIRNKQIYCLDYIVEKGPMTGPLLEVTAQIIALIWKFNPATKLLINSLVKTYEPDEPFASVFIRRGDKIKEAQETEIEMYLNKADSVSQRPNCPIFLCSDDFNVIKKAKELQPYRKIIHFDFQEDSGYDMSLFVSKLTKSEQKNKITKLLAQVEIIRKSQFFIGSYSTNVSVFAAMQRGNQQCYDVNGLQWTLW
jgi:hypothetical protein